MCGRISLAGTRQRLEERFNVLAPDYQQNYNAAPTQLLPVILDAASDHVTMCRWGLIPQWAKDEKIGYKMINARAETVQQKPAFADSFKSRRCLVIADGFYEWKQEGGKTKIPYRITIEDGDFFAMAGLWSSWVRDGNEFKSFTIITTPANNQMSALHDRMPVILYPEDESTWLTSPSKAQESLLAPYHKPLRMYMVSPLVNSPKNNNPQLIEPV